MVSINDCADSATNARGCREDLAPGGAILRAARCHVDFARKELVQGFRHEAERIFLLTPRVSNLNWHRPPDDTHALFHRLNWLGQELVSMTQDVQYIAEDRRVEILGNGAKQLDFCLHSRISLSARASL